jgi:hypothetical protein
MCVLNGTQNGVMQCLREVNFRGIIATLNIPAQSSKAFSKIQLLRSPSQSCISEQVSVKLPNPKVEALACQMSEAFFRSPDPELLII